MGIPPGARPAGGDHAHLPPAKPAPPPPVQQHLHVDWRPILAIFLILALIVGTGTVAFLAGRGDFHPGPVPVPVPVPKGDLRVIFVSDPASNMTQKQLDVINSTKVRGWLNEHCGKAGDGRPAWRSWSKDVSPGGESADWQEAWEATKPMLGPLPEVVVFHGKKGRAHPLPDNVDGLLAMLEHEGGN